MSISSTQGRREKNICKSQSLCCFEYGDEWTFGKVRVFPVPGLRLSSRYSSGHKLSGKFEIFRSQTFGKVRDFPASNSRLSSRAFGFVRWLDCCWFKRTQGVTNRAHWIQSPGNKKSNAKRINSMMMIKYTLRLFLYKWFYPPNFEIFKARPFFVKWNNNGYENSNAKFLLFNLIRLSTFLTVDSDLEKKKKKREIPSKNSLGWKNSTPNAYQVRLTLLSPSVDRVRLGLGWGTGRFPKPLTIQDVPQVPPSKLQGVPQAVSTRDSTTVRYRVTIKTSDDLQYIRR